MVKSMTGYGRSKTAYADGYIRVEIKTFNHKFFELSSKIPENFQIYEEKIKRIIQRKIKRGKVYLFVIFEKDTAKTCELVVDEKKLRKYYALLSSVRKKFNLKDNITLSQLLSFSDVVTYKPKKENRSSLFQAVMLALRQALDSLVQMRLREGKVLCRDLMRRAQSIKRSLVKIQGFVPRQVRRFEKKVNEKLKNGADKNGNIQERARLEAAQFAKNCDVSEELTRLEAHMDNFKQVLRSKKESGKILDFIAQEVHRETNTIGAKSADYDISREVIFIKGEIDKIREQVLNIE